MSWAGLASNQMVTFTNAQGGGFTLNAGQSNVTSNQCMTKSDALTKYNLDASAMSGYANNQLVPKSVWVSGGITYYPFTTSFITGQNETNACSFALQSSTLYTTNSNGIVNTGDVVYVYDGSNYFPFSPMDDYSFISYNEGSTRKVLSMDIEGGGYIYAKQTCGSSSFEYEVKLGVSDASACSASTQIVYSGSNSFNTGMTLYTTSALTTPIMVFTRVVLMPTADIFEINSITGVVGNGVGAC